MVGSAQRGESGAGGDSGASGDTGDGIEEELNQEEKVRAPDAILPLPRLPNSLPPVSRAGDPFSHTQMPRSGATAAARPLPLFG